MSIKYILMIILLIVVFIGAIGLAIGGITLKLKRKYYKWAESNYCDTLDPRTKKLYKQWKKEGKN